jgi:hypothetical protein
LFITCSIWFDPLIPCGEKSARFLLSSSRKERERLDFNRQKPILPGKEINMKGYAVSDGFMGYVNGRYRLFVSEEEYYEFLEEGAESEEAEAA